METCFVYVVVNNTLCLLWLVYIDLVEKCIWIHWNKIKIRLLTICGAFCFYLTQKPDMVGKISDWLLCFATGIIKVRSTKSLRPSLYHLLTSCSCYLIVLVIHLAYFHPLCSCTDWCRWSKQRYAAPASARLTRQSFLESSSTRFKGWKSVELIPRYADTVPTCHQGEVLQKQDRIHCCCHRSGNSAADMGSSK